MQRIIDEISDCIKEYGMKVNENKSKELYNRTWKIGSGEMSEVDE